MLNNPFEGSWAYRSFLRNPDLSVAFNELRFGSGNLVICTTETGGISGTLGVLGWSLALRGRFELGSPNTIVFQGKCEVEGEEWIYDYHGFLSPPWPNGVDEIPAIFGTVVRSVDHSKGKAGLVVSWIAVKN